ncbi:MAG TPA: ABC transporter substrate-binding protein, partial [Nitrospira sp.]|nr:ABC transporter substrate-binding protein [Nitrospira sp.]
YPPVRSPYLRLSSRNPGDAVWCWVIVLLMTLAPSPGRAAQTPTEAVQVTMKDLLYLLTELKETSRSAQRQWEIEQVVRRAFNYEEMAERALGEGSEKTTIADRRQFTRLFVQVLRDDLADKLRDYSLPQVAYLSEQGDGTGTQVLVAPAGREVDTKIEFSVVERSGRWLINDVSIDGASIVATYQTQFSRILREGSFSDLMEFLKQKAVVA